MILLIMQVCLSTQFGHPGDGHGGTTPTIHTKKPVTEHDMGIAHRTWKMGARVRVKNIRTGKVAIARVIDRGPYGKTDAEGRWFNSRKKGNRQREGTYRGCADLTPKLARSIGHNGKELVKITLLKRPPRVAVRTK